MCVFALCALALAQGRAHRSQAWADTQYGKAEAQRETLNGHAEQSRTKREYQTVIASYRKIVLEAPTSSKADGSAFLVAQLTAEMGRHFKDDMALYAAVERGQVPAHRLGRRLRFRRAELDALLDRGR